MCVVPDRSAATLLPIIQRHVRPGTVVHSDEWAAYRSVQQLNLLAQHSVINHSLHFVDTASNTHKQYRIALESGEKKFKIMKGIPQCSSPIWMSLCGGTDMVEVPLQLFAGTSTCAIQYSHLVQ